jgi:hypothetical protein
MRIKEVEKKYNERQQHAHSLQKKKLLIASERWIGCLD